MSAVRTTLHDTWRGMIQRRLWPVALLLVLALAAVPLLLLAEADPAPVAARAEVAGDAAELVAQPLVAVASASDRDRVRRVLGDRKDPFKPTSQPKRRKQAKAATARKTSEKDRAGSPAGSSPGSSTPTETYRAPSVGSKPAPAPTPSPDSTPAEPARPAGSLSVRWGASDNEELEEIDIERLDPLPSPEDPVIVYLGASSDGDSAVFLVDAGVTVEGDARCRPNPGDCQTFELQAGETEFIEVETEGGEKVQYQLDLVKIHGRRAERAKAARRAGAGEASATRRALRSLGQDEPEYRFDARTGTLELIGAGS